MPVSEPHRTFPRLVSALLASAAVAVLSVPAAQSAVPSRPMRPSVRTAAVDLYRGQQWTLGALHLPRAWKYSRGNGVTVAVLDTGVDGHQPDLTGRIIDGPDFTGHARKPGNRYWGRHGTEMASLIAAHGHGSGGNAGIMGVAPDAKILSIRVTWELGDPMRNDHAQVAHSRDAIAKGIRYATDHGAQVISMSLGGGKLFYNGNPLEEAAIKYALGKGVVLVASSGNDGANGNRRNYPAAYPGVIAVGAVDRTFKPAKFTNRHAYVSVAAPGVEIVSADVSGHGYVLGTGTSSSAALVAGMSALLKARYPHLTPDEVKQALEQGTTHRPADGRNTAMGTGVADALGSLRAAAYINKAEHGGASVKQPQSSTAPEPTGPAPKGGVDLMLVAVLSGGGTLLVLSLILGWRQRRRRLTALDADDEDIAAPVAGRSPAEDDSWRARPPARATRQSGSSGRSPWEPRPSDASSPWEPRPSEPSSPWEPRSSESPSPWEPSEPSSAWGARGPSPAWEPSPETTPGQSDAPGARPGGAESGTWDATARWRARQSESPSWRSPSSSDPLSDADPSPGSTTGPFSRTADAAEPPTGPLPSAGAGSAEPPRTEPFAVPGVPSTAESGSPFGDSAPATSPGEPPPAAPVRPPSSPETPTGELGDETRTSGQFPAVPQDFRAAGDADPLSDGPIDSSSDIGTPLADESWESIRRGFDRLKEDTRNWGSPPLLGGGNWSTPWGSPDAAADPPPATPEDDSEN